MQPNAGVGDIGLNLGGPQPYMKMRLRSNSVRFRLTKTEVAAMQESGECSESILFPNGTCRLFIARFSVPRRAGGF
jgi:hypothetical protein